MLALSIKNSGQFNARSSFACDEVPRLLRWIKGSYRLLKCFGNLLERGSTWAVFALLKPEEIGKFEASIRNDMFCWDSQRERATNQAPSYDKINQFLDAEKKRAMEFQLRRDKHATELGIDPTLIASRGVLNDLAESWDKNAPSLMAWQHALLS